MDKIKDLSLESLESYEIPPYDDDYNVEEEDDEEDIEFFTTKVGSAPMDYLVVAQTSVCRFPEIKPVYVLCWSHPESLDYYVSDYPVLKNGELLPQEERKYPREAYKKIEDAGKSDFFKSLFHIDKAVDKKYEELKRHELDTKYTPHGLRIVGGWHKTFNIYGEAYNRLQPEHHEYVQVHSRNGQYTYTASHTSYARQHELGELYSMYFDEPPKQEYFVRIRKLKDLNSNYSYFSISFKTLQHQMMNEMLEVGIAPYETRGQKLSYDPLLTSVRGAPGKSAEGQLAEATIDINSYQRVYIIAVNTEGQERLFVSSRSLYLESMPNMYHAFDFEWQNVILKQFASREEALNDPAYGNVYPALFRLMKGIKETKKPYIWRKGCADPYGFADIEFSDGMGAEQDFNSMGGQIPPNLNLMMQPHP